MPEMLKPEVKFQGLTKKKKWMESYIKEMINTEPKASHASLVYGYTGSGKTFFQKFLAELGVTTGTAKTIFLNIPEGAMLEDMLGFMFPYGYNPDPNGKPIVTTNQFGKFIHTHQIPRNFSVAIYIPVSESIPDLKNGYPENPFECNEKSGIVPFTIPVNALAEDEHVFSILHGSVEFGGAYRELQKAMREFMSQNKNASLADIKKIILGEKRSKLTVKRGYMNVPVLHYSSQTNEQTIAALATRLSMLEHEGIVSSRSNPHCLPKLLKKELMIPNRIVLLYCGFIDNVQLKYLCQTYFAKTIYKLMGGLRHDINYKIVIDIDEAQDMFMAQRSKTTGELGKCMLSLITHLVTRGRKYKVVPIIGTQSQLYLDDEAKSNFRFRFAFKFTGEQDLNWLSKELGFSAERLRDIFNEWEQKGKFRFFMIGGGFSSILQQQYGEIRREYGLELPRPTLSSDKPLNLHLNMDKPRNWSALGLKMSDHITKAKQTLKDEWETREGIQIEKWKKHKEESKFRIQKEFEMRNKQTLQATMIEFPQAAKSKLARIVGIVNPTLDKYMHDMLMSGMIKQEDIERVNQNGIDSRAEKLMGSRTNRPFPDKLKLLDAFDSEKVSDIMEITYSQTKLQLQRWLEDGIIMRIKKGEYKYITDGFQEEPKLTEETAEEVEDSRETKSEEEKDLEPDKEVDEPEKIEPEAKLDNPFPKNVRPVPTTCKKCGLTLKYEFSTCPECGTERES